ncbi:MAG: glycosyltransferase family 2 protein [Candidatus Hydrogenedentes bacterium]|nr:glycosyltransferase family 2 protein [Candidatus Hydrogenedentota bacterium]MBI3119663.1 glycosyltransferase family 2 protein [Candidatus Hydrogenedentota bacterium]
MPLVSVVIPAYNAEAYLAEAIESVLTQAHRPLEIIVADDGSTDDTAGVAARYAADGVHRVWGQNGGTAAALNHGLGEVHGEYLAFLDADDLWTPEKLHVQLPLLEASSEVDAVFGLVEGFATPELGDALTKLIHVPDGANPWYCKGSMLIRASSFFNVGHFAAGLQVGDFIEWYLRAQEKQLKTLVVDEVVLRRRYHQRNQGIVKRDCRIEYVRSLKAALDRRRKQAL